MLQDMTNPLHRKNERPGTFWHYHAIFVTADGLDYCREALAATSHASAVEEAREMFAATADSIARKAVTGFRIECW